MNEMHAGSENPEMRTQQFFNQQFTDLAEKLVGMTIAVPGTANRITISTTDPYTRESNGKGVYKPVLTMQPGTLAGIDYPFRKAVLPLLAAREGELSGACVRINGATVMEQGKVRKISKGADILGHLGISAGESVRLAFLDPSNTLFVVREDEAVTEASQEPSNQQKSAGTEIDRVFDALQ